LFKWAMVHSLFRAPFSAEMKIAPRLPHFEESAFT
jgi:hypothetical protein